MAPTNETACTQRVASSGPEKSNCEPGRASSRTSGALARVSATCLHVCLHPGVKSVLDSLSKAVVVFRHKSANKAIHRERSANSASLRAVGPSNQACCHLDLNRRGLMSAATRS